MDRVLATFQYFGIVAEFIPGATLIAWFSYAFGLMTPDEQVATTTAIWIGIALLCVSYAAGVLLSSVANEVPWLFLRLSYFGGSNKAVEDFVSTWGDERHWNFLSGIAARARVLGGMFGVLVIVGAHLVISAFGWAELPAYADERAIPMAVVALALAAVSLLLSVRWWRYWQNCQQALIRRLQRDVVA